MKDYIDSEKQLKLRGQLRQGVSLAQYTSWKVGGMAEWLYQPADFDDLAFFLSSLSVDVPLFWLGHGTNLLVREQGVQGVVILMRGALQSLLQIKEKECIYAEASVACSQLARFTVDLGLTGFEFLAGIPGTVGGALAMNAGAYGAQIWDDVTQVITIDRNGTLHTRSKSEYQVSYRQVICPATEWFVGGHFKLRVGNKERSLQFIQETLSKRKNSQPLHLPNAGSVFRNPVDDYAARLIEQCGLKGYRIGGACVSEIHANFIVNDRQASADDIEKLIEYVAHVVEQQTGIYLKREVQIWNEK